jgi:hypothetical protein
MLREIFGLSPKAVDIVDFEIAMRECGVSEDKIAAVMKKMQAASPLPKIRRGPRDPVAGEENSLI